MDREQAYELARSKFSNKNLFKHVLAVEAVMRELAAHFGEDQERWGLAGLLHDLDYEQTMNDPERHTLITEELLRPFQLHPDIIEAIKCHNDKAPRTNLIGKAIYAADPVTGLIVAAALMHPEKKLKSIDVDFILRRFKEKRFAAGANREQIKTCEDMGLSLEQFLDIALTAMQRIDKDLGL
ncbi:MAG: HDIG domain-containing protein [candidate division KSB1 bacterium]|nr:HDIG domain-containing protein [candidate division KSB1 bacterium]MDZ7333992.1 HDIG domain-containing protein [candidate division KSB1 bacterium]MDZ7357968.1 HDIG domain-containing protein [candidate division KSB1 bacterium]MDZ7375253.1 HDIG domain-containing protein [candidate division KSB1 bacterium]MDZ7399977.1 HDIG domain-containing protein [candidate division KSB1 bacterium]